MGAWAVVPRPIDRLTGPRSRTRHACGTGDAAERLRPRVMNCRRPPTGPGGSVTRLGIAQQSRSALPGRDAEHRGRQSPGRQGRSLAELPGAAVELSKLGSPRPGSNPMALGAASRGWTVGLPASSQRCQSATVRELAPTHAKAVRLDDACPAPAAALPSRPGRTFRRTCLCSVWRRLIRVGSSLRPGWTSTCALNRIELRSSRIHIREVERSGVPLDSRSGTSTRPC